MRRFAMSCTHDTWTHTAPIAPDRVTPRRRDPLSRLWALLLTWERRARQRQELARTDPRLLRDMGIPEDAARQEARKPFWMR
jgi:uncharacterized protein YjiS (DUF1127 family)